jgi:hypothetical protein
MRIFESRVLRRIFQPKWEKVGGGQRRLHSEELHNLYLPPTIIRVIRGWAGHGREEKCVQYFGWKT